MKRCLTGFMALLLTGCMTAEPREAPRGPWVAINADFADPAIIKADDGYHYAYATEGRAGGQALDVQIARSQDFRNWEHLGDALPVKPVWASRTQDVWAPHVARHADRCVVYYSAKSDAAVDDPERGLCLSVATADRPDGPFTGMGKPLLCGDSFVNIDPMLFDDPQTGKRLLYWGSGFGPVKVQELAPDGMSFAPGSAPVALIEVVQTHDPAHYRRLVKAPWVVHREGWYDLFFSGDNCCGPNAHYAVMVARLRSATGPFELHPSPGGVILAARPAGSRRGTMQ